ncbi:DUF2924 domain-containing protein [Reyranella soli]|uniref:DUF2924 domain-containing protein n=1 Tax=Reyranella soli TaxID=1230389 RepID=A0A512NRT6_9HYPH|nr:hypothetical protein RSO01_88190 [Reyranella soli]
MSRGDDAPGAPELEAAVSGLNDLNLYALRQLWSDRIGRPPQHLSADLLRRRLAYELQCRAYGTLKPQVRRRLGQLHEAFKADPNYMPSLGQALSAGMVLVRSWRGVRHRVTVRRGGFEYRGHTYQSLSEIAKLITGAQWSGPAFFGYRRAQQ